MCVFAGVRKIRNNLYRCMLTHLFVYVGIFLVIPSLKFYANSVGRYPLHAFQPHVRKENTDKNKT